MTLWPSYQYTRVLAEATTVATFPHIMPTVGPTELARACHQINTLPQARRVAVGQDRFVPKVPRITNYGDSFKL